ncbi:M3 family metallopeptidase [Falsihalocynthiibacter sp. BN13B15]|uniref:M3 family metallopeptidase n=1 Tax=Falsihalocynthiibacter sp. BN13B15 TaxID=3240871 RepID=UPI00350FA808
MTNPLLAAWDTPFKLPPFAEISDDDFEPAVRDAMAQARAAIAAISENPDTPTFANTIDTLEQADENLGRVLSVFYNLAGADSSETREKLQRVFSPLLAEYSSDISMNAALFARIDSVWNNRKSFDLTDEQLRVLELTRRGFVRSGAQLSGDARDQHRAVKARLAVLGTEFSQNLLADERDWFLPLLEDDLAGLPEFVVATARAAGVEKKANGPVVTLSRSLIVPFLQFSERRDLRQLAYEAWVARGANGGKTDNRKITSETLKLRETRAQLLGYDNFAAYKLETEMAKTPEAVRELLMSVWDKAKPAAEADAAILENMMLKDGVNGPLEAWDWRYYSEKRRLAEHDLDEAELKPYFQLDRMIEASFDCAYRLFGLEAKPLDVPLYHPDCRAWEISRNGVHVAVFIGDYFARGSKRSGAWCSAMRSQKKLGGEVRPIVVNVCNFAKPSAGEPALLSYDDARTLFHEFGHALHQMLSDVTYESVSGTSVSRDFVELPSQLFEHWLEVPEVLEKHALHAVTGAPIPRALLDRLLAAQTYNMGFSTVEYVASALVDLDFHNGDAPVDTMARQSEILASIGMPHAIRMRHATPGFAHVFSGDGYSSAYYSYMWSEVMDADAFLAFEETGDPFDPETAKRLEKFILSTGGSQDSEELYLQFRGRMPKVDALLKGRGLV